MVFSALWRKSITDLSRRRSRTAFTVATLALAVLSIGLFALPTLMDRAMHAAVVADQLPDVAVDTRPLTLDRAQLAALAAVPNVRAVATSSVFSGWMYVGARRAFVHIRGIPDFTDQRVDVVHVVTGAAPATDAVLTDVQNADQGLLRVHAGDGIRIIGSDGVVHSLRVSGAARNLAGGQRVAADGVIMLYATPATVAVLSGVPGFSTFSFRLADTRPPAVDATITTIRGVFAAVPGFTGFTDLPQVRAAGDWPGKASYQNYAKFFYVITALALLSALVLIANTMTTLVAEQTSEIGIMKAIGGRRRQVAGVYLQTALLLGALGTVAGVILGLVVAYLLTRFFGATLYGVNVGFGIDPLVILASAVVGLLGPPLAALPAIRRATRVPVREALQATGSAVGSEDAADRLLRRIRFLPRDAQIGVRSVGRRRRRALATAFVIALAVGTLLALVGFGTGVSNASQASWRDHGEDVKVTTQGQRFLGARAAQLIRFTPGVATVEPMFVTDVHVAGTGARIWAVQSRTMFHYDIVAGRWYTPAEEGTHARVAVVERDLARTTGTHVGDTIRVATAAGFANFRVIGIAANQQENGTAIFVPLATMHALLPARPADANDYWVRTTSHAHTFIDQTTTRIEDTLAAHGYDVGTEIVYVELAKEIASYRTLTTTIVVLGFLIVTISMAGLVNALTMSVLERTREIGILRALGARARDIRRIFATETVVLALSGWLIGIPVGYLLNEFLVWLTKRLIHLEVPFTFPAWNVPLALAGTILLALLITLVPIGRAVRIKPGDALRYT